ncbi:MAG: zinc-ribbon domain-containing protein [Phycisphaerales bacterium]
MARRSTREEFDDDREDDAFEDESSEADHADRDTAYCPECGAEIYDSADVCPKCFTWLDGETSRHRPGARRKSDRLKHFVIWALILSMVGGGAVIVLARLLG